MIILQFYGEILAEEQIDNVNDDPVQWDLWLHELKGILANLYQRASQYAKTEIIEQQHEKIIA